MSRMAPLSILSSSIVLDASYEGWSLLEPSEDGDRTFRFDVTFSLPFSAPPVVHVAIVGLDVSKEDNVRIRVKATDVTVAGFTLVAETWLNTKIWSVAISWLAIGT